MVQALLNSVVFQLAFLLLCPPAVEAAHPTFPKQKGPEVNYIWTSPYQPIIAAYPIMEGGSPRSGWSEEECLRNVGVTQYIYALIDYALVYPSVFVNKKIQGEAIAYLKFSPEGRFLPDQSSVKGDEYLRSYVWQVLKKTLRKKLPNPLLSYTGNLSVRAHFKFELTMQDDAWLAERKNIIAGNTLVFYRNVYESKSTIKMGPVSGNVFSLVQGEPTVNFDMIGLGWMVYYWVKGKKQPNPLDKYKDQNP